nr:MULTISPECIES: hypothetical protein [unclassified Ruegeria]
MFEDQIVVEVRFDPGVLGNSLGNRMKWATAEVRGTVQSYDIGLVVYGDVSKKFLCKSRFSNPGFTGQQNNLSVTILSTLP